ncbi:MAG: cytochrome-c oxidase, cbb3-type subunit III [Alphaproteobacteria bacterium]|nr:cytochrome-c oxidase, cbb3-type subunit III [Alphaproteobacteria bacterium]
MVDPNKPKDIDAHSGVETTGHDWDGIKELNNPAPRWWLWIFYACCIWAVGYWVVYPAWPTLSGNTAGVWQWTQYKKLAEEQAEITARRGEFAKQVKAQSLADIKKNPELYAFAVAGGKAAFKENCAACHGTGAAGGPGYPNLNDDDWLWGGKLEDIYTTLKYGVRSTHDETRTSQMPAFGKDGILKSDEIASVADYVLSLSSGKGASESGGAVYSQNCASCHGDNGKGNRDFGAPNLTDAIWLYGNTKADIVAQVNNPRHGVMPTWEARLPDETVKQLAIYVHSLGGGE